MPHSTEFYVAKLDDARRYFKEGVQYAESDEDLVDLLGAGIRLEGELKGIRALSAVELSPGIEGDHYKFKQGRTSVKTFNTHGLLVAFATAMDMGVLETMLYLIGEKAMSITWTLGNIEKVAALHDVSLTFAAHDIEDSDPDHLIGKRWKDGYAKYEPV